MPEITFANPDPRIVRFAELLEQSQAAELARRYPALTPEIVKVHAGKKYVRVDIGGSGRYMIDMQDRIYGIKGYGVIHRGHFYGNLDTIEQWNWSGYRAVKRRTMAEALEESAQHYHDSGAAYRA